MTSSPMSPSGSHPTRGSADCSSWTRFRRARPARSFARICARFSSSTSRRASRPTSPSTDLPTPGEVAARVAPRSPSSSGCDRLGSSSRASLRAARSSELSERSGTLVLAIENRRGFVQMTIAIWAEGLVKRFGETTALAGVDLVVRTGTVLGLLGPNGAGKTTAVRILTTLLPPDGGSATVGGYDVVRDAHRVRQLIGLTGQYAAVDENLTGAENLLLIGRLLGIPKAPAKQRAQDLLDRFHLDDAADRATKTYSGG